MTALAVSGLTALLWTVGIAWLVADYRYAARLDSFDRHCEDAAEMGADDWQRWEAEVKA